MQDLEDPLLPSREYCYNAINTDTQIVINAFISSLVD